MPVFLPVLVLVRRAVGVADGATSPLLHGRGTPQTANNDQGYQNDKRRA